MPTDTQQRVYDLLHRVPTDGLEAVKRLFWTELNYERADEPLSCRGWPDSLRPLLRDTPVILAQHQSHYGSFDVIYARLASEQRARAFPLSLIAERQVVTQLLPNHPYALFLFSDPEMRHWHLVNVRYDQEASSRRVFRRIAIGPHERLRTASERVAMLDVTTLSSPSPLAIQQRHDEAFDVEAVTRRFFDQYADDFQWVKQELATQIQDEAQRHLFTQRLFNRLLFLCFLQKKGWLDGNPNYLFDLFSQALGEGRAFYHDYLWYVLFCALNNVWDRAVTGVGEEKLRQRIGRLPFLNGGLFEMQPPWDLHGAVQIGNDGFERVFTNLLMRYNFTVTESTPLDIEVAVDPEMLGRIFEKLVTGRHESGSYYTPKPVVSFMCREALKGYLESSCAQESSSALRAFVDDHDPAGLRNPEAILDALKRVKACDPACGSGAYLLGLLHELLDLRACLFATRGLDPLTAYQRKLEIIQHSLYGVDIDPFAVNIARLRLWLSLVVDFEDGMPPPLPNLDFKIEAGDSLIGPDPSGGLQPDMFREQQVSDLFFLKGEYLAAHGGHKAALRQQIDLLRAEIAAWAHPQGAPPNGFDWAVEFAEVFAPQLAAVTVRGSMPGVVNASPGPMELVAQPEGGFDVVLANPPYVRQELLGSDYKALLKPIYPDVYAGTADLYVYFYARALQLLRPDGMLAFISSNKFMRAGYGSKLRGRLAHRSTLQAVIDLGDLPIFEATTYPAILVVRNRPPSPGHALHSLTVDDLDAVQRLSAAVRERAWRQPQATLRVEGWTLARPAAQALMDKLRRSGTPLGEYVSHRFYYGIKTGLNEAFVIDQATRDRLVAEDPCSAEIIRPWLRGRDVKRWRVESPGLYVIYAPWDLPIRDYPAIRAHLLQYESPLKNRPEVKEGRFPWYALSRYAAEYAGEFDKPKIIYPHFNTQPNFAYDDKGALSNDKTYIIPGASLYLLGLLNSRPVEFFLRQVCPSVQQGYMELRTIYIEQIPVPAATSAQRAAIESLVRRLLDAHATQTFEVLETSKVSDQVRAWEAELNALVYQVYELTEEEIGIVQEGAVRP